MQVAGLLVTGGRSSRMGRDKATMRLSRGGPTFASNAGRCLRDGVAPEPALEVGPGASGLPTAADFGVEDPQTGPLTAVVAGAEALRRSGFCGPVVVLATDLPLATVELVSFLAGFPRPGSVVPVVGGRMQPLAARWSEADLETARRLAALGERSVRAVFRDAGSLLDETVWRDFVPGSVFSDVDEPGDLAGLATGSGSAALRPAAR